MTIFDAASACEKLAEQLRAEAHKPLEIRSGMTIDEADKALAKVFKTYSIDLSFQRFSSGGFEVEWQVWDGSKHYKSQNLTGAVQQALAAHKAKTEPKPDLEEVQAAIDAAAPYPCVHNSIEWDNDAKENGFCEDCGKDVTKKDLEVEASMPL